jgi:hypothetical protein
MGSVCRSIPANGESPQSVRARLAANNLTPEQIEMLMNKGSEAYYKDVVLGKNLKWMLIGIPLLLAAPFLITLEIAVLPYRFPVAGIMCLGFGLKVLVKIKRV